MKKLIIVSIFHLLTFISIGQNQLPMVGLSTNNEGIVGWNDRHGNFGHLIPAPYNVFGNDTAYYYLRARTKGMFDAQGKGGMHGNGNLTGFPLLSAKLTQYGKTIANIHVDFTDTDLDSDTKGTEWDLVNDLETRTYTGGNYIIRLDNDTLLIGSMPNFHLSIDYNAVNTPFDDNIFGKTDYSSPRIYVSNIQANSIKEIAKAFYEDINNQGLRFKFNSIQPAGQTEFDNGSIFAGYFNVADALLETSSLALPNFHDTMYLCVNDSIKVDAGKGFGNYEWNTGFVGPIITITQPGEYFVSFDYQGDRYTSKRILVLNKPVPLSPLPQDVTVCQSANVTFDKLIQNLHLNTDLYLHTTDNTPINGKTTVDSSTYFYPIQYGCPTPIWGEIIVKINNPKAPQVSKLQEFCNDNHPRIHDLIASNANQVKWYSENVNGTLLNDTTLLQHNSNYFATNTDTSGCESSDRSGVLVKLNHSDKLILTSLVDQNNLQFNWNQEKNINQYVIKYQINNHSIQVPLLLNDTTFKINDVLLNDTLHIWIDATNKAGCVTLFDTILIYQGITQTKLIKNIEHIQIYPNPAKSIQLHTSSEKDYDVIIVNLNGKKIFEQEDIIGNIEISGLEKGLYFVEIKENELITNKKVVVE